MSRDPVPAFNLYAYAKADDDGENDARRHRIPDWNLERALRWALAKGFDTVLIEVAAEPARGFPGVIHHVCRDPSCPGGC